MAVRNVAVTMPMMTEMEHKVMMMTTEMMMKAMMTEMVMTEMIMTEMIMTVMEMTMEMMMLRLRRRHRNFVIIIAAGRTRALHDCVAVVINLRHAFLAAGRCVGAAGLS